MAKGISIYQTRYLGYDKDNNLKQKSEAGNADDYINLQKVFEAKENVKTKVDEGLQQIASSIEKIECGQKALVVADKTMRPIIEELAAQIVGKGQSEITPLTTQVETALDEIYERACSAHDDIQKQLNSQAESACWTTGVTNVKQERM